MNAVVKLNVAFQLCYGPALGLTQPLTEMSTSIFVGVKGGWSVRLMTSLPSAHCLQNSGALMSHNPMGPMSGIALSFVCSIFNKHYIQDRQYIPILLCHIKQQQQKSFM
jgi:hypothetical protein